MAKEKNQKLKLLRLMQILMENTDDEHGLTMEQIIEELGKYDISAERKSISSDMEALQLYGIDIVGQRKRGTYLYHVGGRKFELAELKLLVDAVQSSKFITASKSKKLIKKLSGFLSKYDAKKLQRQVYVSGRIKNMNESIYYNVDFIHEAIASNVMIQFKYYKWNEEKKFVLRNGGKNYVVSPWGLLWDAENYYLIAYDSAEEKMKHYRVDKMKRIELMERKREGRQCFCEYDMAIYTKKYFGMFHGKEEKVKMQFKNELAGVVIDRFGKDVAMRRVDGESFVVSENIVVSEQFFGWIFALGEGAKIIGPDVVVEEMKGHLEAQVRMYGE